MPTDTRHVLKFRKDPYRGIDGLGSEKIKQHLYSRCRRHIGGGQWALKEARISRRGRQSLLLADQFVYVNAA